MTSSAVSLSIALGLAGPAAPAPAEAALPEDADASEVDAADVSEVDAEVDPAEVDAEVDPVDAEAEADDVADAEAEPASSGRSVWKTSTPPESTPPPSRPSTGEAIVPPGGYWDPGEAPEVAPPGGEEQRIAGYILLPLGTLTLASAAVMTYLTMPGHCQRRTTALGYDLSADDCEGLLIYNAIRVGYGAAAVITGAVLIGIGFAKKKRLEEWKRRRFQAGLAPGARGRAVSAHFSIRF